MFKILKNDRAYQNNLRQYTKADGMLSLLLFGIMILNYSILAILQIKFEFIRENILLVGCMFNAFMTGITILFIRLKKQTLDTIGLSNGKWKGSIITGTILASFLFYNNCLSHLIAGSELISIQEILVLSIYYLLVSVCEEVVFRGYIGTRIYGLFKKKWLAVFVAGILFIIMHFPYRMIVYKMTLHDLTINNLSWIADLFITHTVLTYIYSKTNSLYGAIIPHWMSNFAYNILLR
ncbi:MAG: CPBP family intramembrane metalloprotease [Lachnospiraceae bacterium]|nr:CPBP family intramembrane metalloprotease [Lachnospiraceae bacterium]